MGDNIIKTGMRLQKALATGEVDYDDPVSSPASMPPETRSPGPAASSGGTIRGTNGRELPAFHGTNEIAEPIAQGLNKLFSGGLVPPKR